MLLFRGLIFFITFLYAFEPITPIPEHIKYNKQKAQIGKLLYFDPILSRDRRISCASCHEPQFAGADNKQFSIGVFNRIDAPMNSPATFNAVFNIAQFWNGRAKNLKQQAAMANQDHLEMDMTPEMVEDRINHSFYKNIFQKTYKCNYVTYDMVMDSIAEFERALITPNSKFDLYLKGKVKLFDEEERGYFLFKSYGCITCHNGVNIGGNSFQKMGAVVDYNKIIEGRDRFTVTKHPDDKYVYKVPSLRNIMLTAPYFHDGSVKTIDEAIRLMGYYNLGVVIPPKDRKSIIAFFKTLTGRMPEILRKNNE